MAPWEPTATEESGAVSGLLLSGGEGGDEGGGSSDLVSLMETQSLRLNTCVGRLHAQQDPTVIADF
jgi:hypothetical protein